MSRPSSMAQRPLTLTEELEKLEQSITLTLQEIDTNFSQAHRIVTTSILPVVEQYAEHSRDVWEGAKFWKQFFEASANVSLSGYEERPDESTVQEQTTTEEDTNTEQSNLTETQSYDTPSSAHHHDLDLSNLHLSSHSTPRAPSHEHPADDNTSITISPYESLKKQINETDAPFDLEDTDSPLPTTPGKSFQPRGISHHDISDNPLSSSPFVPPVSHEKQASDPVMHRLNDKTYRVQATPLGKNYGNRSKFTITPKQSRHFNDSPMSSPEMEAPQLHAEIFDSPYKTARTPGTGRKRRPSTHSHLRITPQPGTSVLTPAKSTGKRPGPAWDSDDELAADDFDESFGASPPKTMQFHIPQSRLMKTPAKEASKRIVEDLLTTAGADEFTDDIVDDQSPSVIRRVERLEDETF